jgi:ubiquitin C-terminal hydrolase
MSVTSTDRLVGLHNFGATCYINSVLQVLLQIKSLVTMLSSVAAAPIRTDTNTEAIIKGLTTIMASIWGPAKPDRYSMCSSL